MLGAWSEADLEGLDHIFGRPVAPVSALTGSFRGGDARDLTRAPDFAGLDDLRVDLSLPVRETLATTAPDEGERTNSSLGTDSSLGSDSSPELSVGGALEEASRGLEKEAAEGEEQQFE